MGNVNVDEYILLLRLRQLRAGGFHRHHATLLYRAIATRSLDEVGVGAVARAEREEVRVERNTHAQRGISAK